MPYDLIMIVTFVERGRLGAAETIDQMLRSVIDNNQRVNVCIILVNQPGEALGLENNNPRVRIEEILVGKQLSLSAARNIALAYLRTQELRAPHVTFPDDDSTYDGRFFEAFADVAQPGQNYLMHVYNEGSRENYLGRPFPDGQRLTAANYKYSMSSTIIVAAETLERAGGFDEKLGVGARFGSCEDHDFYLRCCRHADFAYSTEMYVFHPSRERLLANLSLRRIARRFITYGEGYMYFARRHGLYKNMLMLTLRAIPATGVYFLRLKWKGALMQAMVFWVRLWYMTKFLLKPRSYFEPDEPQTMAAILTESLDDDD